MTLTDPNYMEALLQDLKVIDNNRRIVERLKKRIEVLKDYDFNGQGGLGRLHLFALEEFQKILGEQK